MRDGDESRDTHTTSPYWLKLLCGDSQTSVCSLRELEGTLRVGASPHCHWQVLGAGVPNIAFELQRFGEALFIRSTLQATVRVEGGTCGAIWSPLPQGARIEVGECCIQAGERETGFGVAQDQRYDSTDDEFLFAPSSSVGAGITPRADGSSVVVTRPTLVFTDEEVRDGTPDVLLVREREATPSRVVSVHDRPPASAVVTAPVRIVHPQRAAHVGARAKRDTNTRSAKATGSFAQEHTTQAHSKRASSASRKQTRQAAHGAARRVRHSLTSCVLPQDNRDPKALLREKRDRAALYVGGSFAVVYAAWVALTDAL